MRRVQQALITIFKNWGTPQWIRVDNGRPFADPQREIVPLLALWLIGLGIKVKCNPPRKPTDNAKVERAQGVLSDWIEAEKCQDTAELQDRVWEQAEFYNYHFPIRRLNGQKRIAAFPTLRFTDRPWNPADFHLQRVLDFLAPGQWQRKVSSNGQIQLYGQRFSVSTQYRHQRMSIKLCPKNNEWNIFDANGDCVKAIPTPFSAQALWKLDLS